MTAFLKLIVSLVVDRVVMNLYNLLMAYLRKLKGIEDAKKDVEEIKKEVDPKKRAKHMDNLLNP